MNRLSLKISFCLSPLYQNENDACRRSPLANLVVCLRRVGMQRDSVKPGLSFASGSCRSYRSTAPVRLGLLGVIIAPFAAHLHIREPSKPAASQSLFLSSIVARDFERPADRRVGDSASDPNIPGAGYRAVEAKCTG